LGEAGLASADPGAPYYGQREELVEVTVTTPEGRYTLHDGYAAIRCGHASKQPGTA